MATINHVPADAQTRPTMREAYGRMRALYEEVYGPPDPKIWTNVNATCGDSYSGFIPEVTEEPYDSTDPFVAPKAG